MEDYGLRITEADAPHRAPCTGPQAKAMTPTTTEHYGTVVLTESLLNQTTTTPLLSSTNFPTGFRLDLCRTLAL